MSHRYAILSLAVLAGACSSGDGSDIGPFRADLPSGSCKVAVFDDAGRGVVGARVAVRGTNLQTITGRSGRGDLGANLSGVLLLAVDGANAAAANGDQLGRLTVAAGLRGRDFPFPVYLPGLQGSSGLSLSVGTQTAPSVLDDLGSTGARITIPAGTSIGMPPAVVDLRLQSGPLQPQHLPDGMLMHPTGAWLLGRGIYIDPPEVTFFPPVDLEANDDLLLGGLTATLFHLDQDTGVWQAVADGFSSQGGLLQAPGALARGGLYAFGCVVTAGTVAGRVVDAATPARPLPGMQVVVDGRSTITAANGTFTVNGVAATLGVGTRRSAQVLIHADGFFMPAVTTASVAMNAGSTVDAGDLVLDTLPATTIYLQMIRRGRADGLRSCTVSSLVGGVAQATLADSNGQAVFEDIPSGWFGFQSGYPENSSLINYGQGAAFVPDGRRWQDASQFIDRRQWGDSPRTLRLVAVDPVGGGPLQSVALVRGRAPGAGLLGTTREGGATFASRDVGGRLTASLESRSGSDLLVHALSIERPGGEPLEFPMQIPRRSEPAAFDRHGVLVGRLTAADPAQQHRIRASRRFELQEWWQEVFAGGPAISRLPVDVDPALTHDNFRVGVAAGVGHVVAIEASEVGGLQRLEKLGLLPDLVGVDGGLAVADLALDQPANTVFSAAGALAGLDAAIAVADLRLDLALQQASGLGIDVARGLARNHTAAGLDLQLTLPALSGGLVGYRWWGYLAGGANANGFDLRQGVLLRFQPAPVATAFLPIPEITVPAPGATIDPTGFTVEFSLPPGTLYGVLELRSQGPGETLVWEAYVPPEDTAFAFVRLPTQAATPLRSGKTYQLSLTAFGSRTGVLIGTRLPYQKSTSNLQSIGAVERGVDSFSSRSLVVQTN